MSNSNSFFNDYPADVTPGYGAPQNFSDYSEYAAGYGCCPPRRGRGQLKLTRARGDEVLDSGYGKKSYKKKKSMVKTIKKRPTVAKKRKSSRKSSKWNIAVKNHLPAYVEGLKRSSASRNMTKRQIASTAISMLTKDYKAKKL